MRVLFLDLASHAGTIACVDDSRTVVILPVDHRLQDNQLLPALEETLAKAGWSYGDLTHIACVTGPGGFTSLRSAVALANVLADQLKIPVAGIHVSDVYEARVVSRESYVVWMHSTKKTALFIRTFGIDDSKWNEPTFITIDELLTTYDSRLTQYAGELIPEHREQLKDLHLEEAPLKPLEEILPIFLSSASYDTKSLVPWYGRGW